jgi:hypothetical protein
MQWEFINSFGGWASALGTFAAAFVALYLASRANRVRLRLRAGLRVLLVQGQAAKAPEPDCAIVSITNVGLRSGLVLVQFWRLGFPRRRVFLTVLIPDNLYSARLPIKLADGDSADLVFLLEAFRTNMAEALKPLLVDRFLPLFQVRLMKIVVTTSAGRVAQCSPERELRQLLLDIGRGVLVRKPDQK